MDKKVLIKLGGRKHLGEERWRDALNIYDEIYCACTYREPSWDIPDDRIKFIVLPRKTLSKNLIGILVRTKQYKMLSWFNWLLIYAVRLQNKDWLSKIHEIGSGDILCSYSDYDSSDLTFILAKNALRGPVVRSYKETRKEYNFLEYHAFKYAETISLYDEELKTFIERKYSTSIFIGKEVLIGLDENVLPECILSKIKYQKKLSKADHKVHIAILTFRVDSAPGRSRDQYRYYYIDIINQLMNAGLVVHLHCAQYNDDNGINRYKELADNNPGKFYMEPPLEMKHNSTTEAWVNSCEILSRYDLGLLHNIVNSSSVSEFDKINIPHRFFAYEAAHVIPIIEKGSNVVLEKLFENKKCGFVYRSLKDLNEILNMEFEYYTPSYANYLKLLFKNRRY